MLVDSGSYWKLLTIFFWYCSANERREVTLQLPDGGRTPDSSLISVVSWPEGVPPYCWMSTVRVPPLHVVSTDSAVGMTLLPLSDGETPDSAPGLPWHPLVKKQRSICFCSYSQVGVGGWTGSAWPLRVQEVYHHYYDWQAFTGSPWLKFGWNHFPKYRSWCYQTSLQEKVLGGKKHEIPSIFLFSF